MGYENIGILFYGIVLGEQEVPWDNPDHEGDWEKCYLEKTGFYAANPEPDDGPAGGAKSTHHGRSAGKLLWWRQVVVLASTTAATILGASSRCRPPTRKVVATLRERSTRPGWRCLRRPTKPSGGSARRWEFHTSSPGGT